MTPNTFSPREPEPSFRPLVLFVGTLVVLGAVATYQLRVTPSDEVLDVSPAVAVSDYLVYESCAERFPSIHKPTGRVTSSLGAISECADVLVTTVDPVGSADWLLCFQTPGDDMDCTTVGEVRSWLKGGS